MPLPFLLFTVYSVYLSFDEFFGRSLEHTIRDIDDGKFHVAEAPLDFTFNVSGGHLREDLTNSLDGLFHRQLRSSGLLGSSKLLEEATLVRSSYRHLTSSPAVMHIPVRELNPWEPVADVVELAHQPALVLNLPCSLGIAPLPPLVPVGVSCCIWLRCRYPKHRSYGILSDTLVLIEPLITRLLLPIAPVISCVSRCTCCIGLDCCAISLDLSVTVAAADADLLTAHWTILAAILD